MAQDDGILAEYLRRAYQAVDGLWFVMTEETRGFDEAVRLDGKVWGVVAKIQARKARELLGCGGNTPEELERCFSLKLRADGHVFESGVGAEGVAFTIRQCAWHRLLVQSGRQEVAHQVSQAVCPTEGRAWCREFGGEYEYEMPCTICGGDGTCEMRFRRCAGG